MARNKDKKAQEDTQERELMNQLDASIDFIDLTGDTTDDICEALTHIASSFTEAAEAAGANATSPNKKNPDGKTRMSRPVVVINMTSPESESPASFADRTTAVKDRLKKIFALKQQALAQASLDEATDVQTHAKDTRSLNV